MLHHMLLHLANYGSILNIDPYGSGTGCILSCEVLSSHLALRSVGCFLYRQWKFLVQRIISLNCFGCPLSSGLSHLRAVEDEATRKTNTEEQFHSCGIWPMASY